MRRYYISLFLAFSLSLARSVFGQDLDGDDSSKDQRQYSRYISIGKPITSIYKHPKRTIYVETPFLIGQKRSATKEIGNTKNKVQSKDIDKFDVQVFPNPISNNDWLTILLIGKVNFDFISITLTSVNGQKIPLEEVRVDWINKHELKIKPSLAEGLYILNIYLNGAEITQKFLVK